MQIQEALIEVKAKHAIQVRNVHLSKQEKIDLYKQEAWLRIYKPRPDCETYTSDEHMVECVEYRSEQLRKFEFAYRKLDIN
tara:strand:+ start:2109 stop:2351 length:243 start_codon:yes stop_codon:yes gene_type:complete